MIKKISRKVKNKKRHLRIRRKLSGTAEIPRVAVFKSSKHIYAQIIDDVNNSTILNVSTLTPEIKEKLGSEKLNKVDAANLVGKHLGVLAVSKGIKKIRFDRGGYPYHGRVKSLADGLREASIDF
ncbi:MAG: 50S ribosomal protein L18 [Thermodesulfobacteriota bacterium]